MLPVDPKMTPWKIPESWYNTVIVALAVPPGLNPTLLGSGPWIHRGRTFPTSERETVPEKPFKLVKTTVGNSSCPWFTLTVEGLMFNEKSGPDTPEITSGEFVASLPVEVWIP